MKMDVKSKPTMRRYSPEQKEQASGFVYVAFVTDAYSRRIVGWQASRSLRSDLELQLPRSKASPDHSVWVPIANQPDSDWNPTARLEDWLEAAPRLRPTATEAVWLHVTRGDTVTRDAPITAAAINNVVQRRARSAGLENASGYSAHSLRAGFVTEAKNRGIDEADIMRHTRHKSVQIMRRYDRTSGLWIRNATTGVSL